MSQSLGEWRKSTRSNNFANCVEVRLAGPADHGGCAVRDSKDPAGPALSVGAAQWSAFTAGVRAGEFS